MDASTVEGVISALAGIAAAVVFLVRRHDARKDPIPKQAAELAIAQQALGIITDAADWSRRDAVDMRARIVQLEACREEDRARMTESDVRVTRLETLLSHAAAYIEALLRWARIVPLIPGKPIPPLPIELHELVDPQLWVTESDPKES